MAKPLYLYLRGRNADGTRSSTFKDITAACGGIETQGQVKGASRKMTFNILRKDKDYYLRRGDVARGDALILSDSDNPSMENCRFYGVVWDVETDDRELIKSITAWDSIKFLMTSDELTGVYENCTAAEITKKVCKELGVTPGKMPNCDIKVNVNARGKSGYEAIMIAWTETRKQTKKFYYPLMMGYKLCVIEKGEKLKNKSLTYRSQDIPGALINVHLHESSETAVTTLWERLESGRTKCIKSDKKLINQYGWIVGVNDSDQQSADQDSVKTINDGTKHVTVSAVGDWDMQTGWSVSIKSEALTADTLYIEADHHLYEDGIHTMELTLSYENSMDEIENKEEETDDENGGGGMTFAKGTAEEQIWSFLRLQGFSAAATAGIMGNMFAESGCIPDINENDGTSWNGYGLCQWTNTGGGSAARRTNLENWCASHGLNVKTAQGQLNFLMYEYNSYYKNLFGKDFMKETSPEQAAADWLAIFEGCPGHWTLGNRQRYARGYYNRWKAYTVVPACSTGTTSHGRGDGKYTGHMGWPFKNGAGTVTQPFTWNGSSGHLGVDISTTGGTGAGSEVIAVDGGVVASAGRGVSHWTYGNEVNIKHADGLYSRYAHLYSINVGVGERVSKGQVIGIEGNTGNSYGTHLHFEIHHGIPDGTRENGLNYIHRNG